MKALVAYNVDLYYATQTGLIVMDAALHAGVLGKKVYLGEVSGKHSESEVVLSVKTFRIVSTEPTLITSLKAVMPPDEWGTLLGRNPLERLYEYLLDKHSIGYSDPRYIELNGQQALAELLALDAA